MDEAVNDAKSKKKNNGLLVLASARGYLGDVQQLLEMGADAHAKDKRGISALHYASGQGRLEVLQFLWSRGLELDADDPGGRTALHWGVLGNHTEAVSFLISKGGRTALHWGVLGDHREAVSFLISKGAWVEASDGNDETALHIAARSASKEVVKAVLAAAPSGRHPSIKDMNKHGLTPLGEALVAGRCDVAELLVKEGGASIEDRPHGWSLLHITAALGQRSACKWLLSRKLGVGDAESAEGFTPLHCAAMGGSLECAQLLLEAGADRNATDRGGAVPWAHVPEAAGKLLALLKPAGPAQNLPGATQASVNGIPAEQQTHDQAFAGLSAAAQDSQILRWAAVEDEKRLEKALAGHNPEVKKRVKDVQTTRQVLSIQHAINELHEDDDFQQDAGQSRMLGIVDEIRTSASAMANYEKDATVMHVLKKLRRFQMIVSANGHHKVPFVDLIIGGKVGWREKDQNRVGGMRIMLERQTRAAAAAASAGSETAAKAAAEAQLLPPSASGASLAQPAPAVNGGTGPATAFAGAAERLPSAASVSAAEGSASLDAPKIGKPKKRVSWRAGSLDDVAQASSDRAGLATPEELAQLGQPEQFTWKAFGRALAKQLLQSALMVVVFLIAMYLSGQPMPWQSSAPAAPGEL